MYDEPPRTATPAPQPAVPPPQVAPTGKLPWLHIISCLASLLVNMLFIILLGLLVFPPLTRPKVVIIEASMPVGDSGGPKGSDVVVPTKAVGAKGAEPISPIVVAPAAGIQLQDLQRPQVDLSGLRKSIEESALPNLPLASAAGSGSPVAGTLLAGRDPRIRSRMLNIEGGTERTELAVAMGLRWIAKHQLRDGSWSLNRFPMSDDCRGQCHDVGVPSDTSATALALLPFLGAGFTHKVEGDYRQTVDDGLRRLVAMQDEDGGLMGRPVYGNTGMYAHGQATMALCEAYALSQDSKLRVPAQKAVDFIVAAQHSAGGWRYFPDQPGDTSVVGWQLMALRSAQMAGLDVPEQVFKQSNKFLASVQKSDTQALFGYMPHSQATETMTAEGLLCRLYSGWRTDFGPLLRGADWLLKNHLPKAQDANMYYWYYASQTMHHLGGERWRKWNERMRPLLIELQEKEGHEMGSWTPTSDHHDAAGGRLYMTALAVCTLEVYYRHLPIYRNEATPGDGAGGDAQTPEKETDATPAESTGTRPKRRLK
ncbi:MAG: terpene cyclase/mutase family protein [Pirellulales bacterium]